MNVGHGPKKRFWSRSNAHCSRLNVFRASRDVCLDKEVLVQMAFLCLGTAVCYFSCKQEKCNPPNASVISKYQATPQDCCFVWNMCARSMSQDDCSHDIYRFWIIDVCGNFKIVTICTI